MHMHFFLSLIQLFYFNVLVASLWQMQACICLDLKIPDIGMKQTSHNLRNALVIHVLTMTVQYMYNSM